MAETGDASVWVAIGTAIGGFFSGVGGVLGLNKIRASESAKNGEANVSRTELDTMRSELSGVQRTLAQHEIFVKTVQQIHDSLARLHERMDAFDTKLARMEGFEAGRKSMEHS